MKDKSLPNISLFRNYALASCVIFASVLLFNRESPAQQLNHRQRLEQYLSEFQTNKNIASISAGILHKGKIVWLDARGFADLSNRVPATPRTIYRIASISKIITAVAVMQLWEKGKINLDADALKYIPYFPRKKWKFTTRQILQHTAGLRNYKPGEFNSTVFYSSTKEAVGVISKDPLVYKPGTNFLYTTLGYNLLAAIIENVSGMNFVDYVKKNIFIPADMRSTFPEFQSEIILNKARGYVKDNYRRLVNAPLADLSIKFAGGGFVSNTEDILNFAHCLLTNKLIKRATLDTMLVMTKLPNGRTVNSGLGFEIGKDPSGKDYFGHYGHGTGFVSLLAIYPQDSTAAVDLINTDDRNLGSPALDLASIILEKEYPLPQKPLSDEMMEITLQKNLDSAIASCQRVMRNTTNWFNVSPGEFNLFGYDLLRIKRNYDSVRWFRFFASEFPENISAFIGLGDAYLHDGNKGMAMRAYRHALLIDSKNSYSFRMIKKIEAEE